MPYPSVSQKMPIIDNDFKKLSKKNFKKIKILIFLDFQEIFVFFCQFLRIFWDTYPSVSHKIPKIHKKIKIS